MYIIYLDVFKLTVTSNELLNIVCNKDLILQITFQFPSRELGMLMIIFNYLFIWIRKAACSVRKGRFNIVYIRIKRNYFFRNFEIHSYIFVLPFQILTSDLQGSLDRSNLKHFHFFNCHEYFFVDTGLTMSSSFSLF